MRFNKWVGLVVVAGLAAGLLLFGNASSPGQVPAAKAGVVWEYKTYMGATGSADDRLNELGLEGWELVGFAQTGPTVRYVFKRPNQK